MQDCAGPTDRFDTLIDALQGARAGSAALDIMVSYYLGDTPQSCVRAADLLVSKGFDWRVIGNLWDGDVPAYTRALDAPIEGEAIVATIQPQPGGRWAAVQRCGTRGDLVGWGATEALARRIAGLKALRMTAAAREAAPDAGPSASRRSRVPTPETASQATRPAERAADENDHEWKILF